MIKCDNRPQFKYQNRILNVKIRYFVSVRMSKNEKRKTENEMRKTKTEKRKATNEERKSKKEK